MVTGSHEHYQAMRAAVVAHMPVIPRVFTTGGVCSVHAYLNLTSMAYSAQQHRVPKMLPLFPVEYVIAQYIILIPQERIEIIL